MKQSRFWPDREQQMRDAERLHLEAAILAAGVAAQLSRGGVYMLLLDVCANVLEQAESKQREADEIAAAAERPGKTVAAKPKKRRRK